MLVSDLGTLVGIIIGIVGILIGLYGIKKSRQFKEPSWAIISTNLIEGYGSKLNDLTVRYKSKRVENLTISKILFMNEGAETIDGKDITTANRLRIIGRNGNVSLLQASVLASNQPSNQFSVRLDTENNTVYLSFDYLDQKQGAVIQLVHTGTSSLDIEIVGDIKGAQRLRRLDQTRRWMQRVSRFIQPVFKRFEILRLGYGIVTALVSIVVGLIGILRFLLFTNNLIPANSVNSQTGAPLILVSYVTALSLGLILAFLSIGEVRDIFKIPKGLRVFNQEL